MSALAPTLQAFFTERLLRQRRASPHTIAAYRDTFRLLLGFTADRLGTPPSRLQIDDLHAAVIAAFLDHLEHHRGNTVRTRNARLAAIHSLFRFAALHHPEHAHVIERVLAIPAKRFDRALLTYLADDEIDALLAAPDRATWTGRRDHTLLLVAVQTGLRVSELIGLTRADIHLGTGAHLSCHGKGRKDRVTPLTTATAAACAPGSPNAPAPRPIHCSPPAAEPPSAATRSSTASPSTPPTPRCAPRHCEQRRSPRTPCGTPPP